MPRVRYEAFRKRHAPSDRLVLPAMRDNSAARPRHGARNEQRGGMTSRRIVLMGVAVIIIILASSLTQTLLDPGNLLRKYVPQLIEAEGPVRLVPLALDRPGT